MSLMPTFELGLWNAWIFVLSFFLIVVGLGLLIVRVFFTKDKKPTDSSRPNTPPFNEQEKKLMIIFMVIFLASLIYSVFLPLKLGTVWFYAGLFVYLLSMIVVTIAGINLETTPVDRPATKGLYRISRNPQFFGLFLMFIGVGVACASWVFLLLTMIMIVLYDIVVIAEERWCLEKYADAYREYMNRTPKWIGIPKSRKK